MTTMQTKKAETSSLWTLCFAMLAVAVVVSLPSLALATPGFGDAFGNIMCMVAGWFTGKTGKGLATIGITIIGIGALLGKVSWGMALIVGIGVAVVFGAATIVDLIAESSGVTAAGCNG